MTSQEEHKKMMNAIQQEIDEAHKRIKEKADETLRKISDSYQNRLLEKIAEELILAKDALERGDDQKSGQHKIRADVYKSALDALKK